jgi:D-3-phosphoglycerate dehydrogenase
MSTATRPLALHLEADAWPADALATLESSFELVRADVEDPAEVAALLRQRPYTVLLTRLGLPIDATTVRDCPSLRLVATPTTGLDHLDLAGLSEAGITVVSLRDARERIVDVTATAEHTWALLLACARRLPSAVEDVAAGGWHRRRFLGRELAGATLGIVGHGRLGRRVAGYGRAFGMDVLVTDVDPAALTGLAPGVRAVSDDELLSGSDVVSLHLPLDERTRGWLSAERIARLRPGAIVVNTARGELVDDDALADALADGRLGGLALDVVADDGRWGERAPGDALTRLVATRDDVVITPHIGGWAADAVATTRRLLAGLVVERLDQEGIR